MWTCAAHRNELETLLAHPVRAPEEEKPDASSDGPGDLFGG
jgi:hypothetical protein